MISSLRTQVTSRFSEFELKYDIYLFGEYRRPKPIALSEEIMRLVHGHNRSSKYHVGLWG